MPLGSYDILLVVDESGTATSQLQDAYLIRSFSVKCDAASKWAWSLKDRDSFPIADAEGITGTITGPGAVPIDRRCVGFYLTLRSATPGTYPVRVYAD